MKLTLPHNRTLSLDRPVIVGILNLTPDSFSDGAAYGSVDAAAGHAMHMIDEGADVIDLGGESTRPGASRIDADEQLRRVMPVLEKLAPQVQVPISIDTTRRSVAEAAIRAGASIVNDVSAGRDDPAMLPFVAECGAAVVLMHMLGEPATMQRDPHYQNVVTEVRDFLLGRVDAAMATGVDPSRIILDPGIGFGKTTEHNLRLLADLPALVRTGYPILLGASRKRFLGQITGRAEPAQRAAATAATTAIGVAAGVKLFRVHDVMINRQAADVTAAVTGHHRTHAAS
ncbi:MAG: dihydropteroate synthase [Planctomycetes bacterium]|nr:dihydropteroate synthase [Planctomycetota bacterium]